MKTEHQKRIELFMRAAGQDLYDWPVVPDAETRILRAKLILEEAFETIEEGLGIRVRLNLNRIASDRVRAEMLEFEPSLEPDLIELADGCADLSVVTIGTLSACGISDQSLLEEVDAANLRKFGPGSYRRADGKWIKPPDFRPPDIAKVLREQGG
jgi:predicted HAD superfamily Cof-like phosphohydrolase